MHINKHSTNVWFSSFLKINKIFKECSLHKKGKMEPALTEAGWRHRLLPVRPIILLLNFGLSWEVTILRDCSLAIAWICPDLFNLSSIDEHLRCCQVSIITDALCDR